MNNDKFPRFSEPDDDMDFSSIIKKSPRGDFSPGRLPGIEPELSVPQTDALTVVL